MPMEYGIILFPEAKIESISVSKTGMKINRYQQPGHIIIKIFPSREVPFYGIGFYAYRYLVDDLMGEEKRKGLIPQAKDLINVIDNISLALGGDDLNDPPRVNLTHSLTKILRLYACWCSG